MRIVFDIDGVLADVREYVRDHLVGRLDWVSYFQHTLEFPVILPMVCILQSIVRGDPGHTIYFVTGRPESNRKLTAQWLRENLLMGIPKFNCLLLMRPTEVSFVDDGHERNCDVKMKHLRQIEPDIVFDDDPELVEAARNEGYLVLQVHGYRETKKDAIPR